MPQPSQQIILDQQTPAEALQLVLGGKVKPEAYTEWLEAREKAIRAQAKGTAGVLRCKVSEKGCVSVYGLQRMPISLYAGQWERLLAFREQIEAFITANKGSLSMTKPTAVVAVAPLASAPDESAAVAA